MNPSRILVGAVLLVCGVGPLKAQSESPIRSGVMRVPVVADAVCPPEVPCEPAPAVPVADPGKSSDADVFTRAAAGLGFVNSPAIEVAATALSLEILRNVTRTEIRDEQGQPTGEIRVDSTFWSVRVLNRAAVNFDSVSALATDYLTSLQPSPLTLRAEMPFVLPIRGVSFPIILRLDGRGVPYPDTLGNVRLGGSGHLFVGTNLTRPAKQGTDSGHVYAEPNLYVTYGGTDLFRAVLGEDNGRSFAGGEIRLGYKSLESRHLDIGVVGRCAFEKLVGSTCRISLIGSAER